MQPPFTHFVLITIRYVPETASSHRRIDIGGLLLVATALIGVTYGISQFQSGVNPASLSRASAWPQTRLLPRGRLKMHQ